uniref:NADH-ubiquinone oxidoreductase chain 2 n=1 Tax=Pipa carvalhoi TaxID=191480 RepID=F6KD97_9PIPI|nr:NADH dehydrogenase subunit 2 [Pipa carvalhoi]ADM35684.1 NADH dehydrogenase subunit 2 [Pipa carvalhoi]
MNPISLSVVLSSLAVGTVTTLSSYHWLLAWAGLEINTLAIIPLMTQHHHPRAIEASTKYFLTQATASALILFSSINNAWNSGEWSIMDLSDPLSTTTLTVAMCIKLGLAPFHFWLPEVLQGLNLMTGLILSTWQKMAPMALLLLTNNSLNLPLLATIGLTSTLIGGWGGLNQTHLRKILAFSSIAHLGWMAMILTISPQLTLLNFMIYLVMTSTLFMTLKLTASTKIKTLSSSWQKSPIAASLSLLTLLSLGGLPPLSGFLPKWLIIQELANQNMNTMATIMALSALLSLFFYLRLSYTAALTTHPGTTNTAANLNLHMTPPLALSVLFSLSILLLPVTPMMT